MAHRREIRPNRSCLDGITALVTFAALSFASTALAWQGEADDQTPTETTTTWFTVPVRVGILISLLIVTWAFGFYAVFPYFLDRKKAMRPLAAYGLSAGLIWLCWCASAFLIFQDLLVLQSSSEETAFGVFMKHWLLKCLICLAAVVGFVFLRIVFAGRGRGAEA